ncbi:abscisic acid 8'-hydroxylase CYP707A2-like [Carex rostrata]
MMNISYIPHANLSIGTILILFYVIYRLSLLLLRTTRIKVGAKAKRLPPGTMGWPYVGETLQLYSAKNPNIFFTMKEKRYGPVFKTRILGCPCIMMSSPEAAKFILVTRADIFKPTFPASKERMLGRQAIFFQQGKYHAQLRRLVLRAVMPNAIRSRVAEIDAVALSTVSSWEGRTVNTFEEMKTYAFNVALVSIFGKEEVMSCMEELKRCYYTLEKGYNSLPINLPGSLFHKAMKARKRLARIVANIIASKRSQEQLEEDKGLLASLIDPKEGLTDDQIADNIIGLIFAARDTTASVLTWIVKHLADNRQVLQALKEEQEEIIRNKDMQGEDKVLTWSDTRSMEMTTRVIHETMRIASVISYTFREAVEDVEYEGFLIPKGWKVMPLFRNIHHSPDLFHDPENFDPSRFEVAPKSNTFLAFGNGIHSCPGNELAKLEIRIMLHHLITKYSWSMPEAEAEAEAGIEFGPFAVPLNGLPMTFSPLLA